MNYYIMILVSERNDYKSLYSYYTTTNSKNETILFSTTSIEVLKETVIDLLDTYGKDEIIITNQIDYDILLSMSDDSDDEETDVTSDDIDEIYNEVLEEIFTDDESTEESEEVSTNE